MTPTHPDLIEFAAMLDHFLGFDPVAAGPPGVGGDVVVETVACDLPFELHVGTAPGGGLWLAAAPPTQSVETSVMPVWHRLRFALERDPPDGRG